MYVLTPAIIIMRVDYMRIILMQAVFGFTPTLSGQRHHFESTPKRDFHQSVMLDIIRTPRFCTCFMLLGCNLSPSLECLQ